MKTKKKEKTFEPSQYQKDIFEFIEHGQGNAIINAKAGCGKTSTLIKALDFIPDDSHILFTAFNKDIVDEIAKKTKKCGKTALKVQSIHSIGLSLCKMNLPNVTLPPDSFKYRAYVYKNLPLISEYNFKKISKGRYLKFCDNALRLCELGRLNLAQTPKDILLLALHHEIDVIGDEINVALKMMEWGKTHTETIDFTDMVWLPNVLNMQPYNYRFDWIFCDECQDMNKAQRELVLKCSKINTRMIFVGDKKQCLYAFASADLQSFETLAKLPNTISLPLSISYRCAENIVAKTQEIVPEIEPNNDGRKGEVIYDAELSDVQDGDMILCRNNAPLVTIYNKFLRMGRHAFIKGKDIGSNLGDMVKQTNKTELNVKLHRDGVFARLYADLIATKKKIMEMNHIDSKSAMNTNFFTNKYDMIKTLEVLSEGINTSDELIGRINKAFPKNKKDMKDGIALSTIHKAKGLEAQNVYIACQSLMPSKQANSSWELEQEQNLMYVAYTRAKDKLAFLKESEDELAFNFSEKNVEYIINTLEPTVCRLTGEAYTPSVSANTVFSGCTLTDSLGDRKNNIFQNTTKTITLNNVGNMNRKINSFGNVLKTQIKKR